ncbi:neutral zinc metallopeptidase [Brevibacterium daeguense]|uniref:Neutral zinc metallopeptidase n=1 Tax=Brevibacterium daeguense TaxID=909936 RepID=A0ABP8ENB1_9MICO|nr:neutral zinc metallopeptidase [Brevibacterium daeguense]
MTFNPGSNLDASQVTKRAGGGGTGGPGLKIGGGLGGLAVMVLLALFFGPEVLSGQPSFSEYGQVDQRTEGQDLASKCRTGEDANADVECRVVGTVNSLNQYWEQGAGELGVGYRRPDAVLTSGQWQTACGLGNSNMGPFYCPADETAYFDVAFFEQLRRQFGAEQGPLPEEYVVAHEWGHHIQTLTGHITRTRDGQTGPQSNAVRLELQADCYAGVWAANAAVVPDPTTGQPYLQPLTTEDISDALSAAEAIGDDTIMETAGTRVIPENFTHGSSEQRMTWFLRGYRDGRPTACDTFSVARV